MSSEIHQPLQAEASEKPKKINPWGSVAPSIMRAPVVDRPPETKAHKDHMQRQKEIKELTEAAFAVTIDKSKLAGVQILERKSLCG